MRFAFSAGGVVYAKDPELKILLIQTKTADGVPIWHLPKGTIEKGEKIEATAIREVKEETGADVEIVKRISEVDYFFKSGEELVKKKVYFFLMKYTGGEIKPQPGEIDAVAWYNPDKAREIIAYPNETKLLEVLDSLHD